MIETLPYPYPTLPPNPKPTDRLLCQGALLAWLVETLGVARAVEVGVFTGYSALSVALVLPQPAIIFVFFMTVRSW